MRITKTERTKPYLVKKKPQVAKNLIAEIAFDWGSILVHRKIYQISQNL